LTEIDPLFIKFLLFALVEAGDPAASGSVPACHSHPTTSLTMLHLNGMQQSRKALLTVLVVNAYRRSVFGENGFGIVLYRCCEYQSNVRTGIPPLMTAM
jgi:hypothetical protein